MFLIEKTSERPDMVAPGADLSPLGTQVPHEEPADWFAPGSKAPHGAAARGMAAVSRPSGRKNVEFGDGQES